MNNPNGWKQNPYDAPGGSYGAPGYLGPLQPMPMQPYYQQPQASPSGMAVASLVLAICAWAGFWCVTGIPGFFIARSELAAIDRGQSPPSGKGLATAAYWMCLVNVVLIGIAGAAIAVVLLAVAQTAPR